MMCLGRTPDMGVTLPPVSPLDDSRAAMWPPKNDTIYYSSYCRAPCPFDGTFCPRSESRWSLNFLLDLFHSEVPTAFCAAVGSVGQPWQGDRVLAAQTTDRTIMGAYIPIHYSPPACCKPC